MRGFFPILLLEVNSGPSRGDEIRMLLQAGCIVRLGNILFKSRAANDFILKAFYIDDIYRVTEYTFFQKEVTEGHHQAPIQVNLFCLFLSDKTLTAHWRSIISRNHLTIWMIASPHSSSYSGSTTSLTGFLQRSSSISFLTTQPT